MRKFGAVAYKSTWQKMMNLYRTKDAIKCLIIDKGRECNINCQRLPFRSCTNKTHALGQSSSAERPADSNLTRVKALAESFCWLKVVDGAGLLLLLLLKTGGGQQ